MTEEWRMTFEVLLQTNPPQDTLLDSRTEEWDDIPDDKPSERVINVGLKGLVEDDVAWTDPFCPKYVIKLHGTETDDYPDTNDVLPACTYVSDCFKGKNYEYKGMLECEDKDRKWTTEFTVAELGTIKKPKKIVKPIPPKPIPPKPEMSMGKCYAKVNSSCGSSKCSKKKRIRNCAARVTNFKCNGLKGTEKMKVIKKAVTKCGF